MFEDDDNNQDKRVLDDEGTVARKIKDRIIEARARVDQREDEVYVGASIDPTIAVTDHQQSEIWATSVRQYLRTIEPLLKSDEIEKSEYYYREIPIVDDVLHPPDARYPLRDSPSDEPPAMHHFSLFYRDDMSKMEAIQSHDHNRFSRGFEPPEPERIELTGLLDVIETQQIQVDWAITTNPDEIPPLRHTVYPAVQMPMPKEWLEKTVRIADEFLQEAGVGLEIGGDAAHGAT